MVIVLLAARRNHTKITITTVNTKSVNCHKLLMSKIGKLKIG